MSPKKFVFSLRPGYDMMAVAIANLPKRTGKTLVSIDRKHVIGKIDDDAKRWLKRAYDLDA